MKTPLLPSAYLARWAPTVLLEAWGTSVCLRCSGLTMEAPGSPGRPGGRGGAPSPAWSLVPYPHYHYSPPPAKANEESPAAQWCWGGGERCWQADRVLVVSGKRCSDLQHF